MYQIFSKFKYDIQPKFEVEKFHTGEKIFTNFKEAQVIRKKLSLMSESFKYKVVKI